MPRDVHGMQTAILTKVFSDQSLQDACRLAADIGYDGVELTGSANHLGPETTLDEARDLREHLDDLGLTVPCIATYTGGYVGKSDAERQAELDELEHYCELADVLDVSLIRHGPGGPGSYKATDADYETAAEWYQKAADVAADHGKALGIEIHSNTLVESSEDALRFLDMVDCDNVGAIHDAGNMYISHVPSGAESVQKLGDRLCHVHVKDERAVPDGDGEGRFEIDTRKGMGWYEPTLLGEGDTDHDAVVETLAEMGYDGYLTNECHIPPSASLTDEEIAREEYERLTALIEAAGT
ncbi:sugar phosphate isomerase/epimerase family protein [Haladaptatus sp. GCM10025707]|uniref:sugar phosphate isomerase/epimerase family protein n=2 Tax=Haladaptatus TaxID=367188 RepID=UPI003610B535